MNSINHVMLLGNLTRDPELRYTPSGTAVCQMGVALNRRWKDQAGTLQEETTFVDVTVWGRQAETVASYLTKGRAVAVEGRLQLDTWQTEGGGAAPGETFDAPDDQGGQRHEAPQRGAPSSQEKEDDLPF